MQAILDSFCGCSLAIAFYLFLKAREEAVARRLRDIAEEKGPISWAEVKSAE